MINSNYNLYKFITEMKLRKIRSINLGLSNLNSLTNRELN
jgi:hypothetical protein